MTGKAGACWYLACGWTRLDSCPKERIAKAMNDPETSSGQGRHDQDTLLENAAHFS
jgi:hypothetical protein